MRITKSFIVMVLAFTFLLSGCAKDYAPDLYDIAMEQISKQTVTISSSAEDDDPDDYPDDYPDQMATDNNHQTIEGVLKLYISSENRSLMQKLSRRFCKLYTGVDIQIETYDSADAIDGSSPIVARLLSDPPDIFDTSYMSNAKLDEKSLFLDLNPFLDGDVGVNRADFFDNIFRACESSGNLYHVPLIFSYNIYSLSKQYMAEIGIDPGEVSVLDYAQLLEYWQRTSALHPGEEIFLHFDYNIFSVLFANWSSIMDIRGGVVQVDTPQFRNLLEIAINIPSQYTITPEGAVAIYTTELVNQELFVVTDKYIAFNTSGLFLSYISFLSEVASMKYSPIILSAAMDGSIPFNPLLNLSVTRNCADVDLAWEFIRYCLEYTVSTYRDDRDIQSKLYFPVNRNKFDNQLRQILGDSYDDCVNYQNIIPIENEQIAMAEKRQEIEDALITYANFAALCDTEVLNDTHAWQLIRDDVYLYYAGRQDANSTLRNIQNRLELYINE